MLKAAGRRRGLAVLCCGVLLAGLCACGTPAMGTAPYDPGQDLEESRQEEGWKPCTFTDDRGRTLVLEAQPQRVAVLFSSHADIWQLAGGEVAVTVGESVERGIVADEDIPLADRGAGKTVDIELLLSYRPDFVICTADLPGQLEAAELLDGAGIPCAAFHVESFDDYLRVLRICTDITGDADAYEAHGAAVQRRVQAVLEGVQAGERPQVLFVRAGSTHSATKAKTAENNFVCRMLEELGAENIAEHAQVLLDGLSIEEILESDPDYIFLSTMGNEQAARAYMDGVLAQPEWQALGAVRAGRYAYLPKDLFHYKPNARWDEAYGYLAALLYPDGE